ncbi:MAG: (2Fe-2S)-binding protein, partial [Gemmatimonadetes bacterium]|nr:(2Fe-2S)-binding protein [Gemmatimonadota bacterium]
DVAQCGFCQPGFIMEAAALLRFRPHATSADVEARLATHVCRCGTYTRMRAAMKSAAEER